jgi:hypothetical protein
MRRRRAIALIFTTLVGTGGFYGWRRLKHEDVSPEGHMQQEFKNGDIYESGGWYLSEYEVKSLQLHDAIPITTP